MSDRTPLIVPMLVEALVVNDSVRQQFFRRQTMLYNALGRPANAEPAPSVTDPNFPSLGTLSNGVTAADYYNGVYLKWRMPDALTRGRQDNVTGVTTYPTLPNRWLIVRTSGTGASRSTASFLLESDTGVSFPQGAKTYGELPSNFIDSALNSAGKPDAIAIGKRINLATTAWSEPGTSRKLTAVAPGNVAFARYQPTNNNVFSFFDPLNDATDPQTGKPYSAAQPGQFSYMVIGWYGVAQDDPVASAASLAALFQDFDWTVGDGALPAVNCMVLSGATATVAWQGETTPASDKPAGPVTAALGSNSVEALAALIEARHPASSYTLLLEAFQFDILDQLNEPDGPALVAERLREAAFQRHAFGSVWEIVADPNAVETPDEAELAREATLLEALNVAQEAFDLAEHTLASLKQRLYETWWKSLSWNNANLLSGGNGAYVLPGQVVQGSWLTQALDPTVSGSIAAAVKAQIAVRDAARAKVPWGETPEALAEATAHYAATIGLSASRQLRRGLAKPAHAPNEPVLLLSGIGTGGIDPATDDALRCRVGGQISTQITVNGTSIHVASPNPAVAIPDLKAISGVDWLVATAKALAGDYALRDPASASALAGALPGGATPANIAAVTAAQTDPKAFNGRWGDGDFTLWTQNPWRPFMLTWSVQYTPLSYESAGVRNWVFDGTRYAWHGTASSIGTAIGLNGRIILSPQAVVNLDKRITQFLATVPADYAEREQLQAFQDLVRSSDHWDILSQALSGFNAQLLQQMPGTFIQPTTGSLSNAAVIDWLNGVGDHPSRLTSTLPQSAADFTSTFQPLRAGQFYFIDLAVVDEWGQAISIVTTDSINRVNIAAAPEFNPDKRAVTNDAPLFQVGPAVLQPARLAFQPVDAQDPTRILPPATDVDPICGWILPNHVDAAISAYAPDGTLLGELFKGVDSTGQPVIHWANAPFSPFADLAAIGTALPQFGAMLSGLAAQPHQIFDNVLRAIDETLWSTLPKSAVYDQNLAVLIGRPLALVRARLQFQLKGDPLTDPSWQYMVQAAPAAVTGYHFDILLGATDRLDDGLIGYFVGEDYRHLNIVAQSGVAADDYLKPIGNGNYLTLPFDGRSQTIVSLLVDPRAPVHAITGALPDVTLQLRPERVSAAMAALKVNFRYGPILTETADPGNGQPPEPRPVTIPLPAYRGGSWSWLENSATGWTETGVIEPTTTATLADTPPKLRHGLMALSKIIWSGQRSR